MSDTKCCFLELRVRVLAKIYIFETVELVFNRHDEDCWRPYRVSAPYTVYNKYTDLQLYPSIHIWRYDILPIQNLEQNTKSMKEMTKINQSKFISSWLRDIWTSGIIPNKEDLTPTMLRLVLKSVYTLLCWYSLDSSHWVLSRVPLCQDQVIFQLFFCIIAATSIIRVKPLNCNTGPDPVNNTLHIMDYTKHKAHML